MKHLISYLYHHASAYKTKKSIFNIIIGKKSHQTFFDAVSLNVLSLFGCAPKLTIEQFEQIIETEGPIQHLQTDNHVSYSTLNTTFKTIQLLIQTYSYIKHQTRSFLPITSNTNIHDKVRLLYRDIEHNQRQKAFEDEVTALFKSLHASDVSRYSHYLLTGYDEPMYTLSQICLIESIDMDDLFVALYEEYLQIYQILLQSDDYPILSQCIVPLEISNRVNQTYQLLRQGTSVEHIAEQLEVKQTTIEDHILDLFMKGKLTNYSLFFNHAYEPFLAFYSAQPYDRLKNYKTQFEQLSYFEIKLAIIGFAKGELHA